MNPAKSTVSETLSSVKLSRGHSVRIKNLHGKRFGRLLVIGKCFTKTPRKRGVGFEYKWMCRCDCGTEKSILRLSLTSGATKSCGCLHMDAVKTHGKYLSPEYRAWINMLSRCSNKKTKGWKNYGGRGISVCKRWSISFENFLSDVGLRPTSKHTLDRKRNSGNYTPSNCRWATYEQQNNNTRRNVLLEFIGEIHNVTEWSKIISVPRSLIAHRLNRGWSVEKTLQTPRLGLGNPKRSHRNTN